MRTFFVPIWLAFLGAGAVAPAWAHGGHSGQIDDAMPDAQLIRFCERIRDHAVQAFYNRERGRPLVLFPEDGTEGPRIANVIMQKVYAEPQISSPRKADTFGRGTCNEMVRAQPPAE